VQEGLRTNMINIFIIFLIFFSSMPQIVEAKTADDWVAEGIELGQEGKYAEAIKAYDEALKINPQDAKAWNKKGKTLSDLGRNDDAIKALDEALKINLQYAEAWYNKGTALYNLGRDDEGFKAYDEALKINPQDADAWNNRGVFSSVLEEAMKLLELMVKP